MGKTGWGGKDPRTPPLDPLQERIQGTPAAAAPQNRVYIGANSHTGARGASLPANCVRTSAAGPPSPGDPPRLTSIDTARINTPLKMSASGSTGPACTGRVDPCRVGGRACTGRVDPYRAGVKMSTFVCFAKLMPWSGTGSSRTRP